MNPAAGWYDDPTAPERIRYWDGVAWTPHTQPAPHTSEPEGAMPPPEPGEPPAPPEQEQADQPNQVSFGQAVVDGIVGLGDIFGA